jgi:hypothetical protein
MANPFSVNVVNPLEALMMGEQGFKDMRGYQDDRLKRDARSQAAMALQGGDANASRSALAQLIGVGDYQGAQVLGSLGKADTTDEIKEYNLSKAQGFKGSFTDWKTGLKRAGATSVNNVINSGEKAYDTKVGADYGQTFIDLQKGGRNAVGQVATLDQMEKLTEDPNFYSGIGAERFALPMKQAIAKFGGDPNAAASMETFRALSNKSTLDAMGGSLGSGFSNADRDFVIGQTANVGNTPEGNRQLIQTHKAVAKRAQQVAGFAREYAAKNGRLDAGFDAQLARWAEANPLFKGQASAAPSAPAAPTAPGQQKRMKFNPATGALE